MAHLTDMEELLATIPSADIRDYMREAMNCYMASAYRGCIVLSYIALFDDILVKLGELGNVNSTAKTIFIEASKRKTDQDVYESYLIDQLSTNSLLSGLDIAFLNTLRTLRNKSAHPSGHNPSPEEARFIFFEAVSRFLSRPILSTTQLVDEIVGRLSNANFFPTTVTSDIQAVITEEVSGLHEEAFPQLISKLIVAAISADTNISKNAIFFILGVALLDKPIANKAIQKKLITAKSDDPQYSSLVLQALSANGALISGLSPTCISRVRSALSRQIDEVTAATSETKLKHPTCTIRSLAKALSEAELLAMFKSEMVKLFETRPYSPFLLELLSEKPSIFAIYFPIVLEKAGSSDFSTANAFASAIDALEAKIAAQCTDEQAFQLIVAVLNAAEWGAFNAKGIRGTKFAAIPEIRAKSISYIEAHSAEAAIYVSQKLSSAGEIDNFASKYLTDEEVA